MQTYYFKKYNGTVIVEGVPTLRKIFEPLKPDTRYKMTISQYREGRSLGLNAYYWRVVVRAFCMEWHGQPAGRFHSADQLEEMHAILGERFRRFEMFDHPGVFRVVGTSRMTGREMWQYIDKCCQLYAEYYGGNIPAPHHSGYAPRSLTENDERVK